MSVSYTLRLPDDLKRLVEIEAAKHEQSLASYIVGACWAQLERHGQDHSRDNVQLANASREATKNVGQSLSNSAAAEAAGSPKEQPLDKAVPKPDMDALRAICAGGSKQLEEFHDKELLCGSEVPICGKTWWEDGEHWECLMDSGHKELKHGMRSMVRKLGD